MSENNKCILLAASLHTVVDVDCVVSEDENPELIKDPHITLIYDNQSIIDKDNIMNDIKEALGEIEYDVFMTYLKDSYKFKIPSLFYLDVFSNEEHDFLVMRLKTDNELYEKLNIIYRYIMEKYGLRSEFDSYKPHVTLLKMDLGCGEKYVTNRTLNRILNDSRIGFEDIVYSVDEGDKYEKWNVTSFHALERFFRESRN